jgi:hypothetical protein
MGVRDVAASFKIDFPGSNRIDSGQPPHLCVGVYSMGDQWQLTPWFACAGCDAAVRASKRANRVKPGDEWNPTMLEAATCCLASSSRVKSPS